jgi:clan AA aspartic protease
MIRGHVNAARQAIVPLELSGPNGQKATVDALVDTGFDGLLALPPELVVRLELPFGMTRSYEMGDGRTVALDIHRIPILWDGQLREVHAVITTGGALIGMALLQDYQLFVDGVDGGEVRIQPRP